MFVYICVCLSIVLSVCSADSHHVWLIVAELLIVKIVMVSREAVGWTICILGYWVFLVSMFRFTFGCCESVSVGEVVDWVY